MKAQAESRQTLVLGVYAREFPGGLLKLDPAFVYAEPSSLGHAGLRVSAEPCVTEGLF